MAVGEPSGGDLPVEVVDMLTWLRVERGRAANTLRAYTNDLRCYVAWLDANGLSIGSVSEDDVARFVGHVRSTGLAEASVKRTFVAVRGLHRFLAAESEGRLDPTANLELPDRKSVV